MKKKKILLFAPFIALIILVVLLIVSKANKIKPIHILHKIDVNMTKSEVIKVAGEPSNRGFWSAPYGEGEIYLYYFRSEELEYYSLFRKWIEKFFSKKNPLKGINCLEIHFLKSDGKVYEILTGKASNKIRELYKRRK